MIARAGEGSARDSLSLLDQAMARASGPVDADDLREMLGLADRARVIDLFEHVMAGRLAEAMDELAGQYQVGADPAVILTDLADFTHLVTRLKVAPKAADEASVTETERVRGRDFAEKLSIRMLSRAWQILLKGIQEVQAAPKPLAAADMVLVRLCYAADLPDPGEALAMLAKGGAVSVGGGAPAGSAPQGGGPAATAPSPQPGDSTGPRPRLQAISGGAGRPVPQAQPTPQPISQPVAAPQPLVALASLADCAALASDKRDIRLKFAIERQMRLVKFEQGRIEVQPTEDAAPDITGELGRKLTEWTGIRWVVTVSRAQGRPTIHEEREANQAQLLSDAKAHPTVAALLSQFPGAKVVDVRVQPGEEDEGPVDDPLLHEAVGDDDGDDV